MIHPKSLIAIATLSIAILSLATSAEAFSARQYKSAGRGVYATSSGTPEGFIGVSSEARPRRGEEGSPNRGRSDQEPGVD